MVVLPVQRSQLECFHLSFSLVTWEEKQEFKVFFSKLMRNSPYSVLPESLFNKKTIPPLAGKFWPNPVFCTHELSTVGGAWPTPAQVHTDHHYNMDGERVHKAPHLIKERQAVSGIWRGVWGGAFSSQIRPLVNCPYSSGQPQTHVCTGNINWNQRRYQIYIF